MRRSRAVDWLLLATLLPAYLLIQGAAVSERGPYWYGFGFTGAQGASGHPLVVWDAGDSPVRVGDRLLRYANIELRGLSLLEALHALGPSLRDGRPSPVEVERDGERLDLTFTPTFDPFWWWTISAFASLALAGTFLLLRAPHWHLARRFFAAALFTCMFRAAFSSADPTLILAGDVALLLAAGFFFSCFFGWTEAAWPLPTWQRVLPWAFGLVMSGALVVSQFLTLPTGPWLHRASFGISSFTIAAGLLGLARAYRRAGARERRQVRWVLYGFSVFLLAVLVSNATVIQGGVDRTLLRVIELFVVAIPLGITVSIVGYQYLDIDRLISATASLTILGVALLGGAVAVVPPVANTVSAALGVEPEAGRVALSMALAAGLVPAYRWLRPWLDQRMFAERHELTQRFERLRSDLAACRGAKELTQRAGEGIDTLLRPDSIATYARAGEGFTPLFVRGRAVPPAFETKSALVQVLEAKGAPLFARAKELGPFERAALETLGAEVVVPVLRDGQLLTFTCLATKRSGDIYTSTDLTLLAAIAERCSEVVARLDADEVTRQAQAMQLALRRYVPGAVAERVLKGDALEPAEREVSVLFVDIREYTQLAAGMRAADVFATLNEHTERVSRVVQECGGTVVEFNGDGLMAVFGAPEPLAKKEQQAVEAARRIVDSMPATLAVGVGVATGEAFVGSIRSTDRLIWSAVGSTTNLASRLQSMTRELGASIAIDETTRERAAYVCADFVRHEGVAIRGRTGRFDVFALPLR